MRVIIVAAEAYPYCKVGGLADVVGALFKEMKKKEITVNLAIPFYRRLITLENLKEIRKLEIKIGTEVHTFEVYGTEDGVLLFDCPEFFDREGIYGEHGIAYEDNPLRYAFFSKAVLEFIREEKIKVDILHLNDWQTALIAFYLRTIYKKASNLNTTATVFTIHNLGYQGLTERKFLPLLGIPEKYFTPEKLEFYGKINIMKAGILYSDIITTVSPTYAEEITTEEFGYGLEGVLSKRKQDLYGILNGVDYEVSSPENDPHIWTRYSPDRLRGKTLCRRKLLEETGITAEGVPTVAYIGRLVEQKGLDILISAMKRALEWNVPFFILGEGEHLIEERLRELAREFKGRVFLKIGFDDVLARKLYAGADMVVVPSRYEPCGLVQIIALKYGTIPLVRKTGGLSDTVRDYNPFTQDGYGFVFEEYSASALWEALKRAFTVFTHKPEWRKLIRRAMVQDFSWKRSVEKYLEVYRKALKKKRP